MESKTLILNKENILTFKRRRRKAYLGSKYSNFNYILTVIFENIELSKNLNVLDAFGGGGNFSYCLYENYPSLNITYNEKDSSVFNWVTCNYNHHEFNQFYNYMLKLGWCENTRKNPKKHKENKKIFYHLRENLDKFSDEDRKIINAFLFENSFAKGGRPVKNLSCGHSKKMKYDHWNIEIRSTNEDFFNIDKKKFDIIYLDPPYFNSTFKNGYQKDQKAKIFVGNLISTFNKGESNYFLSYYEDLELEKHLKYDKKYVFKHTKTIGGLKTKTMEVVYVKFRKN